MRNRHILITGITQGLGRALALRFSEMGHAVAGCGRNAESLATLKKEMPSGGHLEQVDVSSGPGVKAWSEKVLGEWGTPDLLLNNAAVVNRPAPLWEVPPEEFSSLMDINIKGVYHVLRYLLPPMIAAGSGVVVNFSSGWGRSTSPEVAPYCASKYAIEGLTASLSQELPRGLAAVSLNPGIINTAMLRTAFGSGASAYPEATRWAVMAAPFLLDLSARDNGKPLTASG